MSQTHNFLLPLISCRNWAFWGMVLGRRDDLIWFFINEVNVSRRSAWLVLLFYELQSAFPRAMLDLFCCFMNYSQLFPGECLTCFVVLWITVNFSSGNAWLILRLYNLKSTFPRAMLDLIYGFIIFSHLFFKKYLT